MGYGRSNHAAAFRAARTSSALRTANHASRSSSTNDTQSRKPLFCQCGVIEGRSQWDLRTHARSKLGLASVEGSSYWRRRFDTTTVPVQYQDQGVRVAHAEKRVFISYRRVNQPWAVAVHLALTHASFDVFLDVENLGSGRFADALLENVRSRTHFLLILTPGALDRIDEPGDWLRREIEHAILHQRNIVPLLFDRFVFDGEVQKRLTGGLEELSEYNSLEIPGARYFRSAMEQLRTRFLQSPSQRPGSEPSPAARALAERERVAVASGLSTASPLDRESQRVDIHFRLEVHGNEVVATYDVRWARDPGDVLHWAGRERVAPIRELERLAEGANMARSVSTDSRYYLEEAGGRLLDLLASACTRLRALLNERVPLRFSLELDGDVLNRLPWEFMGQRMGGRFVAVAFGHSIQRVATVMPMVATGLAWPIEVLGVASAEAWQRERARDSVNDTPAVREGRINLTWLEHATPDSLREALQEKEWHVLHLVGDLVRSEGGVRLVFDDDEDRRVQLSSPVPADAMRFVRVVVLCSPNWEQAEECARQLQRETGVPAVVVMPFASESGEAKTFANEFYSALATALPLDEAMLMARRALAAKSLGVEWALPMLFTSRHFFRSAN